MGVFVIVIVVSILLFLLSEIVKKKNKEMEFELLPKEEKKKLFKQYVVDSNLNISWKGVDFVRLCKDVFSKEEKQNLIREGIKYSRGCELMERDENCWINQWAKDVFTDTEWNEIKSARIKKYREDQLQEMLHPTLYCPSCHRRTEKSKWILESSEIRTATKFDKAYTLGGSTTVFTKDVQTATHTYKCPNCGYKITM